MKNQILVFSCALVMICAFTLSHSATQEEGMALFNKAVELQNRPDFSKKDMAGLLEMYRQCLEIFEKNGDQYPKMAVNFNVGKAYFMFGRIEESISALDEAIKIARELNRKRDESKILSHMGEVYIRGAMYDEALHFLKDALEITRHENFHELEGRILTRIGIVYFDTSQYEKAQNLIEDSIRIAEQSKDAKGQTAARLILAEILRKREKYQEWLDLSRACLELGRRNGDDFVQAKALWHIGVAYNVYGEYNKALESLSKASEIAEKFPNEEFFFSGIPNEVGNAHMHRGEYAKAIKIYRETIDFAQKYGDVRTQQVVKGNLATVYKVLGCNDKALKLYEDTLEFWRSVGKDDSHVAKTLMNIADIYKSKGLHKEAIKAIERASKLRNKIGISSQDCAAKKGILILEMGDPMLAGEILHKSNYNYALGKLALVKGKYDLARIKYQSTLSDGLKYQNPEWIFLGHSGLGLCYEGLKKYQKACEHYRSAIEQCNKIRKSLPTAMRTNFLDGEIFGIRRIEAYEGLSRALLKLNRSDEALRAAESAKARAFSETMSRNANQASFNIPQAVVLEDESIANRLAAALKGLDEARKKEKKETEKTFEELVNELQTERDAQLKKLKTDFPLFAATKYPELMKISDYALKTDEWAIEYDVTNTGICVFLLHGPRVVKALFKPIDRNSLDGLVRKFRIPFDNVTNNNLFDRLKSFNFDLARELFDLLLGDLLSTLPPNAHVIIVPDDCLGFLPFEALVSNDNGAVVLQNGFPVVVEADFFGDRNYVSYYQSMTALTLTRNLGKGINPYANLLVVADPVFHDTDERLKNKQVVMVSAPEDEESKVYVELMNAAKDSKFQGFSLQRLSYTSRLADNLQETLSERCVAFTGLDASKETFLQEIGSDRKSYSDIVIATHGYFGKDLAGVMEPVLIFSLVPNGTDGFLRTSEVMNLSINANTVALIACQSGLGKTIPGEGVMNMGRAFQYAGAKSVLMSLWSVAETSSTNLMESFFTHYKSGRTKIESLKLARQEIREHGHDHPFFWAPFILVGEADYDASRTVGQK